MKKLKFFAASLGLMTLAACSNSDEVFNGADQLAQLEQEDNAVSFSTYMGSSATTRAGVAGSITTASLQTGNHKDAGFGVFAYYTEKDLYNSNAVYTAVKIDGTSGQSLKKANFMYNQQVKWNASASGSNVTNWEYSPMKYWPNEVQQGDVDDQTDPADAIGNYGGNVSFFAYAPYVDAAISETTKGIIAINGETTLAAGNAKSQDPILTYKVATAGNEVVDLLWGTRGAASVNVVNGANTGATYNVSGTNYEKSILEAYSLNADLTKQKTNGKVNFAFKHALSKVGGSEVYTGGLGGTRHGLMVQLDIDNQQGAETDGTLNNTETKVTIKDIMIEARAKYDEDGNTTLDADEYIKVPQGNFNLATGQWALLTTSNFGVIGDSHTTTHIINTSGTGANVAGALNTTIAEPASLAKTASAWDGLVEGVQTTAKNVYSTEAAPLVFIPGTYPELTVTVEYIVRTKDANLEEAYSEVKQKIKKIVTFANPVQLNKQYNLLMRLGLTSVKFDATVSNWTVDGDTNGNGTIDGGEALVVTDVYVPINVAPAP